MVQAAMSWRWDFSWLRPLPSTGPGPTKRGASRLPASFPALVLTRVKGQRLLSHPRLQLRQPQPPRLHQNPRQRLQQRHRQLNQLPRAHGHAAVGAHALPAVPKPAPAFPRHLHAPELIQIQLHKSVSHLAISPRFRRARTPLVCRDALTLVRMYRQPVRRGLLQIRIAKKPIRLAPMLVGTKPMRILTVV